MRYLLIEQEEAALKKRKPQTDTPHPNSKDADIDQMLLSQIKQRRRNITTRNSKKSDKLLTEENGSSKLHHNEESVQGYLDMRKDETNSATGEFKGSIDFEENIFDKYYSLNKDDLSHLFFQNDSASGKYGIED